MNGISVCAEDPVTDSSTDDPPFGSEGETDVPVICESLFLLESSGTRDPGIDERKSSRNPNTYRKRILISKSSDLDLSLLLTSSYMDVFFAATPASAAASDCTYVPFIPRLIH